MSTKLEKLLAQQAELEARIKIEKKREADKIAEKKRRVMDKNRSRILSIFEELNAFELSDDEIRFALEQVKQSGVAHG